ncbi:MAG: GMC family oxidoreductase [Gammaproteobacteria bacterium]|jgi:choline dehydrogenase-like flavoprotein|nr:GMC family oxidoreductase [Gammaproteobacteria bacterium]
MSKNEKVDVVIVGSGAASSVYAALLAEAGKSVVMLEKGTARKLDDLYSSQTWARRLKWATPHMMEESKDSIWYNFNAGHGYGGAAIHHYAVWPRYHPEDMKELSLYGKGLDWPFEYDVLRPYYDQIQSDVGMSGDAEKEIWRPAGDPYPLPPVLQSNHGTVLAKGFAALDQPTSPIPMAILSQPYKGRDACIWDGWCDAGCPTGALANPLVVFIPRALKAGAMMKPDCHVTRVMTDTKGERATGVEYFDSKGERHEQHADVVVLCAFTIENPRILLNSATDKHAKGLANSSGTVGKYIMSHPAVTAFGMFDEDMQNYIGATGGQLLTQHRFPKEEGAFGSQQWEIALALKPNDLLGIAMSRADLFGNDLHRFMKEGSRGMSSMVAVIEDLPQAENRIELSDKKDKYGMPLALAKHSWHDETRKLFHETAKEGLEIIKAAGAKEAWHSPPGGQHIMGGTIMGHDPTNSVTNENAQCHDVPNLVMGGGGVFPTSSCVNSTYTIHAMAMKSAHHLTENWATIVK